MRQHAELLHRARRHGAGADRQGWAVQSARSPVRLLPALDSKYPALLTVNDELKAGDVSPRFDALASEHYRPAALGAGWPGRLHRPQRALVALQPAADGRLRPPHRRGRGAAAGGLVPRSLLDEPAVHSADARAGALDATEDAPTRRTLRGRLGENRRADCGPVVGRNGPHLPDTGRHCGPPSPAPAPAPPLRRERGARLRRPSRRRAGEGGGGGGPREARGARTS